MAHALATGLGLKPEHFEDALRERAEGLWFEVHPENYMVAALDGDQELIGVSEPMPLGVWIEVQVPAGTFFHELPW